MKKTLVLLTALLQCLTSFAWEPCSSGYEIGIDAVYGHNTTWKHYGGAGLSAYLPFHRCFEAEIRTQYMSAGDFTTSLSARPKYALPVGELFLDAGACCRMLHKYWSNDLCAALSVGYRMDYVNAQLGLFTRWMKDMDGGGSQNEAVNILYRISFRVRPASSVWNLGGGASNFTEFEYERPWQPIFFIDGYYGISAHLRVKAAVHIKPTGIFHLTAGYYGIRTALGLTYIF